MYLIDGYNLIFVIHKGKPRGGDIERRREDLLKLLERYAQRHGTRIQVVFDSKEKIFPHGRKERHGRVEATFTSPTQSADDFMIEHVASLRDKRSVIVVSSDRQILQAAEKNRVARITSTAFFKELIADLESSKHLSAEAREKMEGLSSDQVNAWLKEFGLEDA